MLLFTRGDSCALDRALSVGCRRCKSVVGVRAHSLHLAGSVCLNRKAVVHTTHGTGEMMSGNSSVMQWRQGAQRVATLPHPLAGLVALLLCSGVLVAGNDPCVCLRQHVGHLQRPLFLAHVVDTGNIDRFFVLENSGKILEFPSQNGDVPYLDISHRIAKPTPSEIGIGLLGLSLHPNFAHNWKIYVFYTTRTSGQLYGVVSQFQAKTKYQSDPDSEKVLLKIPFSTGQDIGGHVS